jgi:hypothetical protein
MKTNSSVLFDAVFMLALLLVAAQGSLICFLPEQWKALREKFPRGYNSESPGGRMMERYRARHPRLADRLAGAALLVIAVVGLVWFVRQLLGGRF